MKRSIKYLLLITILLITVLCNIIILSSPIKISSTSSSLESIPAAYWILLLVISVLILVIAIYTKSIFISILLSTMYYFIFYAFNLFFKIIPDQTDIGSTSFVIQYVKSTPYLNPGHFRYFEFPFHFTYVSMFDSLMGLGSYETINLGFFSMMLLIPVIMILLIHRSFNKESKVYFIFPILYLILVFFFFNDQFVPQFQALLYLIIMTGCYIQMKDTGDVKFMYLAIFFYTICVFTHPFIFIFFPLGLILVKIYNLAMNPPSLFSSLFEKIKGLVLTFKDYDSIYHFIVMNLSVFLSMIISVFQHLLGYVKSIYFRYTGKAGKPEVSLGLLFIIYILGYKYRFSTMMAVEFRRLHDPSTERGGSWRIIANLIGNKKAVGLTSYDTYPLFNLVDKDIYLFFRLIMIASITVILILIFISIIKTSKKNINLMDLSIFLSSISFLIAGFFAPALLGQRTLQATLLSVSKYFSEVLKWPTVIRTFFWVVLIISPTIFTVHICITENISGTLFYEDDATLSAGSHFDENHMNNITVLFPDRRFYPVPVRTYDEVRYNGRTPSGMVQRSATIEETEVVIMSEKLQNRFYFFDVDITMELRNGSIVYDQGDSSLVYLGN